LDERVGQAAEEVKIRWTRMVEGRERIMDRGYSSTLSDSAEAVSARGGGGGDVSATCMVYPAAEVRFLCWNPPCALDSLEDAGKGNKKRVPTFLMKEGE